MYNITSGQLSIVWFFLVWFASFGHEEMDGFLYDYSFPLSVTLFAILTFYTIGWWNKKKSK
jgi:hypothetical protein